MFSQLRVLELASVLAGPSVGQFFAELGATVVKVENPKTNGDVTRSWRFKGEKPNDNRTAYFSSINWGKKSIVLDVTDANDLEVFYKLVKQSDLVIASFKPGDAEKLKLDYQSLVKTKPDIIYGHITGYGSIDSRVGYDAVIQAESGFMSINGEYGSDPLKMPVALMDILAGHHLKQGLLIALIKKMGSGEGSYVPVSLIDAAVSSLANQASNWLVGGKVPNSHGNQHPNIAPYGDVFNSRDNERVILAVGNDKQFTELCEILDTGLAQDPRFSTNILRVENRKVLHKELKKRLELRNAKELIQKLNEAKVPVGLVKRIDQVFENPMDHWLHEQGEFKGVKNFFGLPEGFENVVLSPPPKLGEHTSEVLKSVGQ